MYNLRNHIIFSFFVTFAIALLCAEPAQAQQGQFTVNLQKEIDDYSLNSKSFLIEDYNGQLTHQDIVTRYNNRELNYRNTNPNGISLGNREHPHWIVFSVQNQTDETQWLLDIGSMGEGRSGIANKFFVYEIGQRKIFYDGFQLGSRDTPTINKGRYIPVTVQKNSKAVFLVYIDPTDYKKTNITLAFNKDKSIPPQSLTNVYVDYIPFVILGSMLIILVGFFITRNIGFLPIIAFYASMLAWYTLIEKPFYSSLIGINVLVDFYPTINAFLISLACLFTIPARYSSGIFRTAFMAILGFTIGFTLLMGVVFPISALAHYYISNTLIIITLLMAMIYLGSNKTYYLKPSAICLVGWIFFYVLGQVFKLTHFMGLAPSSFFSAHADYVILLPQMLFLFAGVVAAVKSDQVRRLNAFIRQTQKAQSLLKARQSKEEKDHSKLLRVIEREREVMEELRARETERTEEMRKAKISADEANQAKSAFLAVVSHEIRTPMTGIMGMLRMLQDTDLSNEQKEYLMTIKDSGDAMLALLNDILDFSKIEGGAMRLETIQFDLRRLMSGIKMLMKGHTEQKGIELRVNIHDNVPQALYGDPTRLRQVILNLVGNALKFTSKGHVGINAFLDPSHSANEQDGKSCAVYFSIEDTGIGISEEGQKKLFAPFSQADDSVSRKYGGTGLGLTICKRLVEAMGGEIKLKSREGSGTTFFFTLPFKATTAVGSDDVDHAEKTITKPDDPVTSEHHEEEVVNEETTESSVEETVEPQNNDRAYNSGEYESKLRFLIVDDNEINRKVVKAFLEKADHESVIIYSGKEALSLLDKDKKFDAIFLDIEMPDMNGKDVAKAILKDRSVAHIPIIALTGNIAEDDLKTYKKIGFRGYVAKPVIPEELLTTINVILNEEEESDNVFSKHAKAEATAPKHNDAETQEAIASENLAPAEKAKSAPALGKTLDEKMVKGLRDGLGVVQTQDLLHDLFEKADEILENFKTAIAENNMESIKMRAHELKGMAGNFGLKAVSDKAGQLEKLSKTGDITMDDVSTHVEDLSTLIERSKIALDDFLNE